MAILAVYGLLVSKQADYHKAISGTSSSVLVLNNFGDTKVKIVVGDSDEIEVDLKGTNAELAGSSIKTNGIFAEFGFSSDWDDVTGTITVPEGILIEVHLASSTNLEIQDIGGEKTLSGVESFMIDSNFLNSLSFDGSGAINLDAWGDIEVWNDNFEVHEGGADDVPVEPEDLYCGIGGQAIRDYCCTTQNADAELQCDGTSYWRFDNAARDCASRCEVSDEVVEEEEELLDCSIGGQEVRNACCAVQNAGEYQGCIGYWEFNNSSRHCAFKCTDTLPPTDDEESGPQYSDSISQYCADINDVDDRSLCCNDSLKNALSTGPRPGFPDCIGEYYFDADKGCVFECSEHTRMVEILTELKQNAAQQQ